MGRRVLDDTYNTLICNNLHVGNKSIVRKMSDIAAAEEKEGVNCIELSHSVTLDRDLTIDNQFNIPNGAIITLGEYDLVINGAFSAGPYQCFNCNSSGTVTFAAGSVKEVYPEWWGAKGDGATDDTASLQAAVSSGARRVAISNLHKITKSSSVVVIDLDGCSNMELVGITPSAGFINDSSIDSSDWWFMLGINDNTSPISNIMIRGLSFYGNITSDVYDKTHQHRHGIVFNSTSSTICDIKIIDCYVENINGDGIYIGSNCARVHIINNRHKNILRQGICLSGVGYVRDAIIHGNIELAPTKTCGGTGIHIEPDAGHTKFENIIVSGNISKRHLTCMAVTDAESHEKITIINNIIEGGLSINRVDGLVCAGNMIKESDNMAGYEASHLVELREIRNGIFEGNSILSPTADFGGLAIYRSGTGNISTTKDNCIIANNIIVSASTNVSGIYVNKQNGININNNMVTSAYMALEMPNCMNTYINNNTFISESGTYAITLNNTNTSISYMGYVQLNNNTIQGGGTYSVQLGGVKYIQIGNVITPYLPMFIGAACQNIPHRNGHGIGIVYGNSAPTYGTWIVGDRIYKQNVATGGVEGLICTTAGASASGAYASGTTYYIGDTITDDGHTYESLQNANTGNTPATSPEWWLDLGTETAVFKNLGVIGS